MTQPIDLRPDHAKIVRDILSKYLPAGVSARVFGSRAKWTAKSHSDLDLALKGPERLPSSLLADLAEAFSESDLPFKVDVLDWRAVAPSFQTVIDRDGIELTGLGSASIAQWIETTIGEQATLQRGIDITQATQRPGKVPVISSGGVSSYHDTPGAKGPGVLLGRKGVVGSVYYVSSDYWPHDTTLWVKDFHGNVPRFVYYFFKWMARRIASMDVGSANPTLNRNHVHPIKILWPKSRREQTSIVAVLGALDDKIDLNRRMNETLEAMARAIFKDWFVDFGPTRAKMEGRAPYLAPETWALFPERLDNEGRPEGWQNQSVLEQADWINGAAYKNMHFVDSKAGLPVVKIAELKNGVMPQTQFTNTNLGDRYRIDDGDMLFSWSGNPDTSIDTFIWTGGPAWLNQHIFAIRENGRRKPAYLYSLLKWLNPAFAELARNKQTTGLGHVTKDDLKRLHIVVPPSTVDAEFNRIVEPTLSRVREALFENRTLAATRDLLLPKLMSGEIRVRDAEKIAEEAL